MDDTNISLKEFIKMQLEKNEQLSFERHKNIHNQLATIMKQQGQFDADIRDIKERMSQMSIIEVTHFDNCPTRKEIPILAEKIQKIKDDNDEINFNTRFFNRNPTIFFGMIFVGMIITGGTIAIGWASIVSSLNKTNEKVFLIEQGEKQKVQNAKDAVYQKEVNSINKE